MNHPHKALICNIAAWLLLAGWTANQAHGQADPHVPCQSRGAVVARGESVDPVGELKVRAYRLEESARGHFCLSVTLDSTVNGAYLIWVGNDPLTAYPLRRGELTASFPPEWLEEGAPVSVSRFSRPYELTTHPERLALPESIRRRPGNAPGGRMEIKGLRRITREVEGAPRRFVVVVVTGPGMFGRETMNNNWVIQIGRKEFYASVSLADPKELTCAVTEEEFAALKDGDPVRVNWGFRALPHGVAGKSFARLDKSMVVDGN